MNPSILLSTNPSSQNPRILFSPFISSTPISLSTSRNFRCRRQYRISTIRSCATTVLSTSSSDQSSKPAKSDLFGGKRELTGIQSLVDSMSPPIRIASSTLIVAGAIAAGYGLGSRFVGSRNVALGGAVALGAAGAGAAYALNSCVPEVAAANLHNYAVDIDDPGALKKEDVEAIANKYGVSKQNEAFNAEICDIYCRYVSSILPTGSEDLKGDEVETIVKFKKAFGIDDPDAAAMHMEIGRRIFRQRMETGDREADSEQRRAFQRLIYVSSLVFGEASSFLLPWKRVFRVTDSQVEIAIRDNAQRLYGFKLESINRDVNVEQLVALREAQLRFQLSDELAAEMFKEKTRKLVEENISRALDIVKSRTRAIKEASLVVEELNKILEFNNLLISLGDHPDASCFACGIGPVSLLGGDYDDRKIDDLKLLYRVFITDSLSSGCFEENKIVALGQLRNIFGLGKREAESITLDVTSKVYRKRLAQAVTSGDLVAADSKAAYLQNLCEELRFDPEKAITIHEDIYRQKLQNAVTNRELSDEDVKALERLQILLCIPKETVEAAHKDICGALFEKVVKEAITAEAGAFDLEMRNSVRKAAYGLRLTREVAMSVASRAVRKVFLSYIQSALKKIQNAQEVVKDPKKRKNAPKVRPHIEGVQELKGMILFNKSVVTQLLEDIKDEASDKPPEEPTKEEVKVTKVDEYEDEEGEWKYLQSLKKVKAVKDIFDRKSQSEINLKDVLPERERIDLYKRYLQYCLTEEVTHMPFSVNMPTKKGDSEYIYLSELGEILGLTGKEIVDAHRTLAERTYRKEAEVILADGQLTEGKMRQLGMLQQRIGLPPQDAQKITKIIKTRLMAEVVDTTVGQGRLSITEVRELKEAGVDVDTIISKGLRQNLFKKTVDNIFSSGTGEFDEEEVYEKIPEVLKINPVKAKEVVHDLAKNRLSNSLIQAVALLRQKNHTGVVSSLNNLLACDKAVPATPLSWEVPEELSDMFVIYLKSEPAPEKLSRLQYLLGISDQTAETLKAMKDSPLRTEAGGSEEEEFVF